MSTVIPPTVGRVVYFWPSADFRSQEGAQPQAAIIAYVHGERMVNIAGFDCNGAPFSQTSVQLAQPGDAEVPKGSFVEWMPFQIGQAAKTIEAQAVAAQATAKPASIFNNTGGQAPK